MRTVVIIASLDTKIQEVLYMKKILQNEKVKPLVVDMSTGQNSVSGADISREEVLLHAGLKWKEIKTRSKGELIQLMLYAMKGVIRQLYEEGKMDGVLAAGGVQNTTVATKAMQELPIGFPKVMVTTIASGNKHFNDVVGNKDIIVIPSIVDFTGENTVTWTILKNACVCVASLAKTGVKKIPKSDKPVIGVTMMGITNIGCMAAIKKLQEQGFEILGFHATGAGGQVMEEMAMEGHLDGVLDMTPHELVAEYFGGGFSYGKYQRFQYLRTVSKPIVVSLGGLDFIDYPVNEFQLNDRKYNKHNSYLAHIKITKKEAKQIAKIFAERLNLSRKEILLTIPTKGMRSDTEEGESLYDPEVDETIIEILNNNLGDKVKKYVLEGNLDTVEWGEKNAEILIARMMNKNVRTFNYKVEY